MVVDSGVAGTNLVNANKFYQVQVSLKDKKGKNPPGENMFLFATETVYSLNGGLPRTSFPAGLAFISLMLPITQVNNNLYIGQGDGEYDDNAAIASLDFTASAGDRVYPTLGTDSTQLLLTNNYSFPQSLIFDAAYTPGPGQNGGPAQSVTINFQTLQKSLAVHVLDYQGNLRYVFSSEHMVTPMSNRGDTNTFDLGPGAIFMAFLKFDPTQPAFTFEIGDPRTDGKGTMEEVP